MQADTSRSIHSWAFLVALGWSSQLYCFKRGESEREEAGELESKHDLETKRHLNREGWSGRER
jgi:hypothetical protein